MTSRISAPSKFSTTESSPVGVGFGSAGAWPFAGDAAGGAAAARKHGDRLNRDRISNGHTGVGERIRRGTIGRRVEEAHARQKRLVPFYLTGNLVHDRHRFFGPLACRGFGAQHHAIGTIINSIGDVGHFGTGGGRALDHRFEHLRRHDHRLARIARLVDDGFL